MRILVTGGAGFIGSEFVRSTLRDEPDVQITVLDKLTYSGNPANLDAVAGHPGYRFVRGDTCDARLVDDVVAGQDAIVHLAAETHVDRSIASAAEFVQTNVVGTQVLLEAAQRHGTGRFLHVSTDEVYGSIEIGSWTEDTPLAPNVPYAAAKAGSDMMVLAAHRTAGLDVVVTRCTNNYGPHQYPEKVIPRFVTSLLDGGRVPLYGDGRHRRDWLHVSDHCRALRLVLRGGRAGQVYHIGGGTELDNVELTDVLLRACGAGWDRVDRVTDRLGHDRRYSLDISRIRTELGYAPTVDFEDGVAATVEWYRRNRPWWEALGDRAARAAPPSRAAA